MDLTDIYRDRYTLRQFRVFVQGLPSDSRLMRFIRRHNQDLTAPTPIEDMPADFWGNIEHGLADVCDKLEVLYYIQLDPKTRPPKPKFMPRPGQPKPKKRGAAAWFQGMGMSVPEE